MTGVKAPFEVPADIIDVNRTDLHTGALSDYVSITNQTSGVEIKVMNEAGSNPIWTLKGFLLGESINVMDTVAHTYVNESVTYKGIMGLAEQVSSNLFLPDGVFSLWSRD